MPSLQDIISKKENLKIAIIGAMDEEIEILVKNIENCKEEVISGFTFYTGLINQQYIVLLKSGIGKVNAAVGTAILLENFKPNCIINTGSAGGFDTGLNIGDIVISDAVCYHDVDVTAFDYALGQIPQMPAQFIPDSTLLSIAKNLPSLSKVKTVTGLIATGDIFMHDAEKVAKTKANFPTMQACEMEAAAIAQTCHIYQTPFIIFRSLSDIAGKKSEVSFPEYVKQAGIHSAEMIMEFIKELKSL